MPIRTQTSFFLLENLIERGVSSGNYIGI